MRLGIDLDGVIANFNAGWVSFYNDAFASSVNIEDVDSWDVIPSLTHFGSMREFWDWARDINGSSLFRHLDPFPGAVEALWGLRRAGHDVVILTTKPYWAVHDTLIWIGEQRLPTTEVHILDDKWKVACDVYLDDAPHQLWEISRARQQATVCRFVRPWNKPVPGVNDVDTWDEFQTLVGKLAERAS